MPEITEDDFGEYWLEWNRRLGEVATRMLNHDISRVEAHNEMKAITLEFLKWELEFLKWELEFLKWEVEYLSTIFVSKV